MTDREILQPYRRPVDSCGAHGEQGRRPRTAEQAGGQLGGGAGSPLYYAVI
jgi:hypothetical protein